MTETHIRLMVFIGMLVAMMCWEWKKPNRISNVASAQRWSTNFMLLLLGSLTGRLLMPAELAAVVIYAQTYHIGLWNNLSVSYWISVPLTLLLFDCLIYWQHRLFHRIPWLWRLHQVHHADPHIDASTGLRFHPLEIAVSLVIKSAAIFILGAPLLAILIFEILLNATSLFNHTNVKLPTKIEKPLRQIIVTQAMHRIHHSQVVEETDSNFGFNLSIWDRLFGSYTKDAKLGDDAIQIGLKEYTAPKTNSSLKALLLMPFRRN